ncbi:hypothetical protein GCM10007304_47650 [Rhodococcoides trifolii]|uniref:IF2 family translation initiation factor n=1 Tax=Rhodococcoides trifolii TaxID=908250 RepID=A0A917G914_9NOCA|nr:hypothetical protein [Rhodococcus trifolii]GGG28280.1 hypothetical protein GCM10007304_47650 [Rhodococcus trifolii]
MSALTLPRRILRLQYTLVRLPWEVLEAKVISQMDSENPARVGYERVAGTVDGVVGAVLGDADLSKRGEAMRSAAYDRARASALDVEAERIRAEAKAQKEQTEAAAKARVEQAREEADDKIAKAADDEISDKIEAGRKATAKLEADRERADNIAQARIDAAEAEREAKLDEVEREKQEAEEPQKKVMKKAAAKAEAADDKREDAERLSDVVEAKE